MKNDRSSGLFRKALIIAGALLAMQVSAHAQQKPKPAAAPHPGGVGALAPPDDPKCVALTQDLDIDLKKVVQAGCKPSQAQIAKMMDNPVGKLDLLLIQQDYALVKGPNTDGYRRVGVTQIIPTFPTALGAGWTLIHRIDIPIVSAPLNKWAFSSSPGRQAFVAAKPFRRTTGIGDIVYVGLVAPTTSYKTADGGSLVWGIGPTLSFPTAQSSTLGTGKFSVGPSAVLAYLGKDWTLGLFPQQWWSVAGKGNRSSVNTTNLQYFIFRNLSDKWRVGMSPNIVIDWMENGRERVTLPVGLGLNYTTEIAGIPTRIGAEVQYSVVHPNHKAGSRWNFRFAIIPVVPSFMF